MAKSINVDEQTFRSLEFAARISNMTPGEVVARLVANASTSSENEETEQRAHGPSGVIPVYADYDGHRTEGYYDPLTTRIDLISGPLAGKSFKSPTGAARAIISHYKPDVSSNRNGWTFWMLNDGSNRLLHSIRSA